MVNSIILFIISKGFDGLGMGAIILARIPRLVYACRDPRAGAVGSIYDLSSDRRFNHSVDVTEGVMADDGLSLSVSATSSSSRSPRSTSIDSGIVSAFCPQEGDIRKHFLIIIS